MKFFKNRVVAVVIAALLAFGSTAISADIKFEEKCLEVVDGFYDGNLYTGKTEVPIASHLQDICTEAENICALARAYGIDTEDVEWDVQDLQSSMTEWYDDLSYIAYCYGELLSDITAINEQLYQKPLSANEQQALSTYNWNISRANSAINESGYNESVRVFIRENMGSITELFCDAPEYFNK